ncbi:hypothetical protein BDV96DRAFT_506354 [Lophiotrema nucula]|uniref:SMP-30/Gluconolactonase/LRE-like region domain-containing protein n=1 Tax=Lophiotrema nucula TaxID=690887 RepID=A0A6A5YMG7_9PLEO|nr:hypothetical protein BDV96DRAFT_506354 [Lophiotrema nucula]
MRFLLSSALLLAATAQASLPKTIYQFPNPTWVENIRSMSNGSLLVTIIGRPEVHIIDPFVKPATSSLVHSFSSANAVLGITEIIPNTFAVAVGNYSNVDGPTIGSFSIWKIDLTAPNNTHVSKIASIPRSGLINGITTLNANTLLLADSTIGHLLKLDIRSGKSKVVLEDETTKPVAGAAIQIGINGVRSKNGWLYYTNIFLNSVFRVKVDPFTGTPISRIETISSNIPTPDDLDIADDGTVFVPGSLSNTVFRVQGDGEVTALAGNLNSSLVASATGAVLGRTWRDRGVLYVSTTGAISAPVNGTFTEGGKVVALDASEGWTW